MNRSAEKGFTLIENTGGFECVLNYVGNGLWWNGAVFLIKAILCVKKMTHCSHYKYCSRRLEMILSRLLTGRFGMNLAVSLTPSPAGQVMMCCLSITSQNRSGWQLEAGQSFIAKSGLIVFRGINCSVMFWSSLDLAHDAEPFSQTLIENVEQVRFRFVSSQTHEYWPLPTGDEDYRRLPRAVTFSISLLDGQNIERIFVLNDL